MKKKNSAINFALHCNMNSDLAVLFPKFFNSLSVATGLNLYNWQFSWTMIIVIVIIIIMFDMHNTWLCQKKLSVVRKLSPTLLPWLATQHIVKRYSVSSIYCILFKYK